MRRTALCILVIGIVATLGSAGQDIEEQRYVESTGLYPHGRLEIGASLLGTKYFGEYTDKHVGYGVAFNTRYLFPLVPEFGLAARFSYGKLKYERRYKPRFGDDFARQFPTADFPDAATSGTMRDTKFTTFEGYFVLNLFPRQRLNYYLYAGFAVLSFQAQDIREDPIDPLGRHVHYQEFKDEHEFDYHPVGGFGIDFYVTRNISLGVHGGYHKLSTDLLDGYALLKDSVIPTEADGYADFGLKLAYYLFDDNDIDNDGLSNERERELGTNPYSADTDNDGVNDYDEVVTYQSDPFRSDTDGDGISDYNETSTYNTNVFSTDTDSDGISDFDEVHHHHTNPRNPDTDFDGLADYAELQNGSDPLLGDTDGDGVKDADDSCPRLAGLPETHGCPPRPEPPRATKADTVVRVVRDTVIRVREITKIEKGESYTPYGINFKSGDWKISVESEIILDDVARWLKENPDIVVDIRGHTDSDGGEESNRELSKKRADAVRAYLISQGVTPARLSTSGLGEQHPVDANSSDKGKARNRRIEFYVSEKN